MVKSLLFGFMLSLASLGYAQITEAQHVALIGNDDQFDDGSNIDRRPYRKGLVKSLKVYRAEPLVLPECEDFKVNRQLVSEFIRRAKQISAHDYLHENTWSSCTAKGEFRFKDGRHGYWNIQQFGLGYLTIRGKKYYFLCESCKVNGWGAKDPVELYREQAKP